jgi:hypothetical protein
MYARSKGFLRAWSRMMMMTPGTLTPGFGCSARLNKCEQCEHFADLATPVLNQIARRDLRWIPLTLPNMILRSACDSALARLRTAT